MKKKIALFTAFVLLATVVFSAMPFTFAEEADPAEYALEAWMEIAAWF